MGITTTGIGSFWVNIGCLVSQPEYLLNRQNKMDKIKFRQLAQSSIVAATIVLSAIGAAQAVTYNYDFGTYLAGGSGPVAPTFASLSVETTDYKVFTFDLKANALSEFTAGAYLSTLYVDTLSGDDVVSAATILSGYTPGVTNVSYQNLSIIGPGGIAWDIGNGIGGGPAGLLQANEEIRWTTTFSIAQAAPIFDDPAFALTVRWTDPTTEKPANAIYSSTVAAIPEPEIYAMLGVGLGLMGWVGRMKKLQAA
jgi:hypothetical protein